MDNAYDIKQKYHRKYANSSKGRRKLVEPRRRKEGNSRHLDGIYGFQPSEGPYTKECLEDPSYNQQISMISDDGEEELNLFLFPQNNIPFSSVTVKDFADEENNVNDLRNWLKTDEKLEITPVNVWCKNWASIQYECCLTEPTRDESVYNDLKQEFTNASVNTLLNIIRCLGSFPYYHSHNENENFTLAAEIYKRQHTLTKEQLLRSSNIYKKILNRSSYGVLFLWDNKFFTVTNAYGKQNKGAIKGHPTLKFDGQWETPWETAVRETEEEIQYRIDENYDWRSYNLEEHQQEWQHLNYLKCLVKGYKNNEYNRLIGLFIIRLKTPIKFQPNSKEISDCGWHSIEEKYDTSKFYTIHPFIKYIRNHPELYNN